MITPLVRLLKEEGYHVTVNGSRQVIEVLKHNPFVDKVVEHVKDSVPRETLDEYWAEMAKGYDKFINLSESIEGSLLKVEGREEFTWPVTKRHSECNVNYYDRTLDIGGFGKIKGRNGELYFSPFEEKTARDYRKKYKNKFLVLWSLSGSSYHKTYPWAEMAARAFLDTHPDAMILTVGDHLCEMLEWSHPQAKCYSGKWPIRKSMIMTKYVDLVVGTETGILNASGCFGTPKITMLSHSSEENLTKHWENSHPVFATDVGCQPCHQLHYTLNSCPISPATKAPECMSKIMPGVVLNKMNNIYREWKEAQCQLKNMAATRM
jgi:ADP-heptose:LPS heptosyltransferase